MRILLILAMLAGWAMGAAADEGYELLLHNQLGKALQVFAAKAKSTDSLERARALRGLGLTYETAGNGRLAALAYLDAYSADGDPDHLMVDLNSFLGLVRAADTSVQAKAQGAMERLRREHPDHPAWAEFYEEMGNYVADGQSASAMWDYYEQAAPVREWKMAGPFDNVSNSGILRALPPEQGFTFKEKYKGLAGLPAGWQDFSIKAPNGWGMLDMRQGLSNALNYFATSLQSPVAQPVILSFGVSGVFSLWVNGERVAHSAVFQNTGREGYRIRTELRQGVNTILLKLGHENTRYSNFFLRVSDTQGRPLSLKASPMPQAAVSLDAGRSVRVEPALVERFAQLAAAPRKDPEALLQLARHHLSREEFLPAKRCLRELDARYPGSALVASLLGNLYNREDNATLAELQYEKIRRLDTANAAGWQFAYQRHIARSSWQEAYDLFSRRPALLSLDADLLVNHIVSCYQLSRQQEMLAWLDTLLSLPGTTARLAGAEIVGNLGNQARAMQIALGVEAKSYRQVATAANLAKRLRGAGQNAAAIALLEKSLAYNPESIELLYAMADTYFQDKDYARALQVAKRALQVNPLHTGFHKLVGKCLELQGDLKGAMASYDEVLRIGRNDFELADHLLAMRKQPLLRELSTSWDLFKLAKEGKAWSAGREENSLILLSQRSVRVHPWGGFEAQDRMLVEVLDPQGVDDWKEYEVAYESNYEQLRVLRAVCIKPDGKTVQADMDKTQLVFSTLAPGDLIEIIVSRQSSYIGQIAGQFWTRHSFRYTVPLLHSQLEVLVPQGRSYQVKQYLTSVKPTQETRSGLTVQDFRVDHVLSAPAESQMPPWSDALAWVQVSSVKDWGFIADWYQGLTEGKSVETPELRAFADSLFAGTRLSSGALDTAEIMRRTHDFVTREVRYSYMSFRQSGYVPQAAAKTFATRMGDCKDMATLGRALLALAGLRSDLVLVNTNDDGRAAVLPTVEFNHCILRGPQGAYVDFTASHNGWRSLPRSDQGARALVASRPLGDSLRYLPWLPLEQEYTRRESSDTLRADGSFVRRIVTRRGANMAASSRGWYRFQNASRNDLELLRSLQKQYAGAELLYNRIDNLDSLNLDVVHEYLFRSRLAGWSSERTLCLPVPWADEIAPAALPGEPSRSYVYEYWRSWTFFGSYEHRMRLVLPAGWRLLELPRGVTLEGEFGSYRSTFALEKGELVATRSFRANVKDVPPDRYQAFRADLEKLLQADRAMLVLVKE